MKQLLIAGVFLMTGCVTVTGKYHADLKVYGNIQTGYQHQIDGAQCRPMGFLLTDIPHKGDFELKLRCSFVEVPSGLQMEHAHVDATGELRR